MLVRSPRSINSSSDRPCKSWGEPCDASGISWLWHFKHRSDCLAAAVDRTEPSSSEWQAAHRFSESIAKSGLAVCCVDTRSWAWDRDSAPGAIAFFTPMLLQARLTPTNAISVVASCIERLHQRNVLIGRQLGSLLASEWLREHRPPSGPSGQGAPFSAFPHLKCW